MKTWAKVATLMFMGISLAALSGCEDEESNDLAKAQACMDGITSANYATADKCMTYIAGYDSQQANILKCAISFLDGGLTTERVSEAYKQIALNSATVNNEAVFLTVLALSSPAAAATAQAYCEKSGLKGLIYLGNLSVVGTTLAQLITLTPGQYDPADPSSQPPTDAEVNEAIDDCKPGGGGCTSTEYEVIGESIIEVADQYCVGQNENAGVCDSVADAIAGSGGDAELIAKKLLCMYSNPPNGATYDPDAGGPGVEGCVP